MSSETISRRRAVSLLGLAAARAASLAGLGVLGISVPTTLLTVSDAEAQTAGMVRRQERRGARRERRETRRAVRAGHGAAAVSPSTPQQSGRILWGSPEGWPLVH